MASNYNSVQQQLHSAPYLGYSADIETALTLWKGRAGSSVCWLLKWKLVLKRCKKTQIFLIYLNCE